MVGRPGRIKSKGSEASTSHDGETPKNSRKRQGRPRKSGLDDSPFGSRDSTPFSPANPRTLKRRPMPDGSRLASAISEFDTEEDLRSARLARFIEEHPESREEYSKWVEERPHFAPSTEDDEQIEYDGTVYTQGAIVCLYDEDDDDDDDDDDEEEDLPYYAQIRGLIRDSYQRPYAYITWLVPKESAKDAHIFKAEHFVHSLVDHKLYELKCLRWVTERPELPHYQDYNDHRAAVDKERLAELRRRRVDLYKAAHFAPEGDADMIRAGDVKQIHTKEHADDLKEVLDRQREREQERREDMEEEEKRRASRREEGDHHAKRSASYIIMSRTLRSVSTEDLSNDDEEEEGGSERRKTIKTRATSLTSTASKDTNESAPSSVKTRDEPMEEA